MTDRYRWTGGEEYILRHGVQHPIQILIAQPLFEEANRMRKIIVSVMRALDAQGIGCALPDLPATGESLRKLSDVTFDDWRAAFQGAALETKNAHQKLIIASFRGGALVDDVTSSDGYWRCAPETGQRIVRDLMRTMLTSATTNEEDGEIVAVAGHKMRKSFLDTLSAATPRDVSPARIVRLATDAKNADIKIEGTPMWRRSEPGDDDLLVAAITNDLSAWAKKCAAI